MRSQFRYSFRVRVRNRTPMFAIALAKLHAIANIGVLFLTLSLKLSLN